MFLRYQHLNKAGKPDEAGRYLLQDLADKSRYSSIQFYHDNTINPCIESTYAFFDTLVSAVARMHADAGVPLRRFHIGGDETAGAWGDSPACRRFIANNAAGVKSEHELLPYFVERVAGMLAQRGIEVAGWGDGIGKTHPERMPKIVQANAWGTLFWDGHRDAHRLANRNWQVVISSPDVTYFDFPHVADPMERGYYWGSRATPMRKVFEFMPDNLPAQAEFWTDREGQPMRLDDRIKKDEHGKIVDTPLRAGVKFYGLQGQLWSETIRSDAQVEYMLFPRLLALAERAWHTASWEVPYRHEGALYTPDSGYFSASARQARDADWARFAAIVGQKELPKLDRAGIAYRVPTVGARRVDDVLEIRVEFPGLPLEFREVPGAWRAYEKPVPVKGRVEARARSADGRRAGRSLVVAAPHRS